MSSKGLWVLILSVFVVLCSAQVYADAPVNDNFADAIEIVDLSNTYYATNIDATKESGEPTHAGVKGGTTVWWKFTPITPTSVTIDTDGSDFDNTLAVYTGNSVDYLTEIASDSSGLISEVSFAADLGTTYYVVVDGPGLFTGDIVLNFQEDNNDNIEGALELASSLSGTADGTNLSAGLQANEPAHAGNAGGASVWWKWTAPVTGTVTIDTISSEFNTLLAMYDSNDLATANEIASNDDNPDRTDGTSLITAEVQGGVQYFIAVDGYNDGSEAEKGYILLNFSLEFNDDFENAVEWLGDTNTLPTGYNSLYATAEPNEPQHAEGVDAVASVWWKWTATDAGKLYVDTKSSDFSTVVAIYEGASLSELTQVASGTGSVLADVIEGQTYYIAIDGLDGQIGNIGLTYSYLFNDLFADAYPISEVIGTDTSINYTATRENDEPLHHGINSEHSVWWAWTAATSDLMAFDTVGSIDPDTAEPIDTIIAVYTGSSIDSLTLVGSNDDTDYPDITTSLVTFTPTAGQTYYIAVDSWDDGGDIVLNWTNNYNDYIIDAIELTGAGGISKTQNTGATKEDNEPDHAGNEGGASVWWYYTAANDGFIALDTHGSDCNTLLAVYSGPAPSAAVTDLTLIDENDNDPNGHTDTSILDKVEVVVGTTYYIVVDVADGATGKIVLDWQFAYNDDLQYAFQISGATGDTTGDNADATEQEDEGEPAHAGVADLPHASLWWYWVAPTSGNVAFDTFDSTGVDTVLGIYHLKEDAEVVDFSNLEEVSLADAADYRDDFNDPNSTPVKQSLCTFAVTSGQTYYIAVDEKTTKSGNVALHWDISFNDNFADAEELNKNKGEIAALNIGATSETDEPEHVDKTASHSVWWKWTADIDTSITFEVPDLGDARLAAYTGESVESLTEVAADNLSITFETSADTEYYIVVDSSTEAEFTLKWYIDYNDDFEDAKQIEIEDVSGEEEANNEAATKEDGEPTPNEKTPTGSMWWAWTAPSNVRATFDPSASTVDVLLGIYVGTSLEDLVPVTDINDDTAETSDGSSITIDADGDTVYYIMMAGDEGDTGDLKLTWSFEVTDTDTPGVIDEGYTQEGSELTMEVDGFNNEFSEPVNGMPNINGYTPEHPLGILWCPVTSGNARISTIADFSTRMAVYHIYSPTYDEELGVYVVDVEELDSEAGNLMDSGVGSPSTVSFEVIGYDQDDGSGSSDSGEGVFQWYLILVDSSITGSFSLDISLETNDYIDYAFDLNTATEYCGLSYNENGLVVGGYTIGCNSGVSEDDAVSKYVETWAATAEPNEPYHGDAASEKTLWYKWTAANDSRVTFSAQESNIDVAMKIYTTTQTDLTTSIDMSQLDPVDYYDTGTAAYSDSESVVDDTFMFDAVAGTTYYIAVDGGESYGTIDLVWYYDFNDDLQDAYWIYSSGYDTQFSYTDFATAEDSEQGIANASVWWVWDTTKFSIYEGIVVFDTIGSNFDTSLSLYDYDTGNHEEMILIDSSNNISDANILSELAFDLDDADDYSGVYSIGIDGQYSSTGKVVFNWYVITNDDFLNAITLSGTGGNTSGGNKYTSLEPYENLHAGVDCDSSVWWVWTPTIDGTATLQTTGSDFDTVLAVYTGDHVRRITEIVSNDDISSTDTASSVSFYATAGVPYYIVVAGKDNGSGAETGWAEITYAIEEYHTLTILSEGEGTVEIDGIEYTLPTEQIFPADSYLELTGISADGWGFESWTSETTGDSVVIATDPNLSFYLTSDTEITANFSNTLDIEELVMMANDWLAEGFDLVSVPDESVWYKLDDPNLAAAISLQTILAEPETYNGELAVDYEPNMFSTDAVYDQCIVLDGDPNEMVEIPFILDPGSVTSFAAFAWVKSDDSDILDNTVLCQNNDDQPQETGRRWLYFSPSENFGLCTDIKTEGGSSLQSDFDISDGLWHNVGVAVLQDLEQEKFRRFLFGDGKLVAVDDSEWLDGTIQTCEGTMVIGSDKTLAPSRMWTGSIDDLRIYNQALSEDEDYVVDQARAILQGPDGPDEVTACVEDFAMDMNDDCYVNIYDFALLASQWLQNQ